MALTPLNLEEAVVLDAETALREYEEACEAGGQNSAAARVARRHLELIELADRRILDPYLEQPEHRR